MNEYFERYRPDRKDVLIILYAVLTAVYKMKRAVYIDMEHIEYDVDLQRVYFVNSKANNYVCNEAVLMFVRELRSGCRYAGEDVRELVNGVYNLIRAGEIDNAIDTLKQYKISLKKEYNRYYILGMGCVVVCEVIYLYLSKIEFF